MKMRVKLMSALCAAALATVSSAAAPDGAKGDRPSPEKAARHEIGPQNLSIVIDATSNDKMVERAKEAASMAVRRLKETDFVSVIVCGDTAQVLVPAQSAKDKEAILAKISSVKARENTVLADAVAKGGDEVRKNAGAEGLAKRVLIVTGGFPPAGTEKMKQVKETLAGENIKVMNGRPARQPRADGKKDVGSERPPRRHGKRNRGQGGSDDAPAGMPPPPKE